MTSKNVTDTRKADCSAARRTFLVGGVMTATLASMSPIVALAASGGTPKSDYVSKTLTIGLFSGDISALAARKATNTQVQQFAKLEYDEASAVGGLLLGAGASKPARPDDLAKTLAQLQKMEAGDKFDQLYISSEIEGHEKLLDIQNAEASSDDSGMNKTISTVLVPFIESHLAMLKAIQKNWAG